MTSAIQQAIYENNEGTRMVRQCQYDSAVKSFTSVLQILKPLATIVEDRHARRSYQGNDNDNDIDNVVNDYTNASSSSIPLKISFNHKSMEDDSNHNDSKDDTTTRTAEIHPSSSQRSSSSPTDTDTSSTTTKSVVHRKLKHYVFRDPVVIPPQSIPVGDNENGDESESSFYSPALFTKFLMIVMYNLALTLNLHALSLLSSSTTKSKSAMKNIKKLFIRSREIYELTFDLCFDNTNDDDDDTCSNNDDTIKLLQTIYDCMYRLNIYPTKEILRKFTNILDKRNSSNANNDEIMFHKSAGDIIHKLKCRMK